MMSIPSPPRPLPHPPPDRKEPFAAKVGATLVDLILSSGHSGMAVAHFAIPVRIPALFKATGFRVLPIIPP
ncbi:MAG: hypothetical protein JWP91_2378 [Fibrobacteres bacterium]|nr:hypothetical protein [Fibrobacterota bacterium]